jgi:hypothetical protein
MFPRDGHGYGPGMQIRRPVAVFVASLALAGAASLTGCGADPIYSRTGTPADSARLTTGGDPGSDRQGNVPALSNRPAGGTDTKGGVGGGNQNGSNG